MLFSTFYQVRVTIQNPLTITLRIKSKPPAWLTDVICVAYFSSLYDVQVWIVDEIRSQNI